MKNEGKWGLLRNISAEGKGIYLSIMPSVLGVLGLMHLLGPAPLDQAPPDPVGKILELTQLWRQNGLGTEGLVLVAVGVLFGFGAVAGLNLLSRALLKLLFSGYKNTQP